MTAFSVVIPARYASTRLPGKPLLDIDGVPMVVQVWQRAGASAAGRVLIATDDQRIFDAASAAGAEVCMTRDDHESGTDRLAEVADQMQWDNEHIVVNVQGDEPLIPAQVIEQVAQLLADDPEAGMATLYEPISDVNHIQDPNIVKLVSDSDGRALYFSRAPIPWHRDGWTASSPEHGPYRRHIGIYAYRVRFLRQFVVWPAGALEQMERLEQLRALENGVRICVAEACAEVPAGVDTQADLDAVRKLLSSANAAAEGHKGSEG